MLETQKRFSVSHAPSHMDFGDRQVIYYLVDTADQRQAKQGRTSHRRPKLRFISDQKAAPACIARCIAVSARRDLGPVSVFVTLASTDLRSIPHAPHVGSVRHVVDRVTIEPPVTGRRAYLQGPLHGTEARARRAAIMRHDLRNSCRNGAPNDMEKC
jgi:hypothetical protein